MLSPNYIDRNGKFPDAYYSTYLGNAYSLAGKIGSNLFVNAISNIAPYSGRNLIYRSADFGATWTQPTNTSALSDFPGFTSRDTFVKGGLLWVVRASWAAGAFQAGELVPYEPTGDTWGSVETTPTDAYGLDYRWIWQRIRPDDSRVLVYNRFIGTGGGDNFQIVVAVKNGSGGSWSEIGTFDPANTNFRSKRYLDQAVMADDGTVHLAFIGTDDLGATFQYYHASISTANALSAEHLLDTVEVSFNGPPNMGGRSVPAINPTEVSFGYGYNVEQGSGMETRIARGDLTGDPLNPAWATDTASSVVIPDDPQSNVGQSAVKLAYVAGKLRAYISSTYNSVADGASIRRLRLYTAEKSGAWPAMTLLFQSPGNGNEVAPDWVPMNYFDVLIGFAADVGVLVDVSDGDFTAPNFYGLGYSGPSIGNNSFGWAKRRGAPFSFAKPGKAYWSGTRKFD